MYLFLVFISAFFVRLIHLNQSLWLDEAVVAKVVKTIPFFQIPFQFSPGDFHPPLYYLFMSLWSSIFGYSEISLRMPSIILSLIAGWYVFKIAVLIKDKQTGLWASAFFLFNPLIIYYSQEARMYMMATMFLSAALYYFFRMSLRAHSTGSVQFLRSNILMFNLFSALALLTFYGSAFFIAAIIITSILVIPTKVGIQKGMLYRFRIKFGMTVLLSAGVGISLLILSPLLAQQFLNAKISLTQVKNWNLVLGKVEFKNIFMLFIKFTIGRLSWYPKWSYYVIAGIVTTATWLFVIFGMRKNKIMGFLLIVPILLGLFVSFWAPMMMYFRFVYLILVMSILLAQNKTEKKFIIGYGIILIFLVCSLVYLLIPYFHREDWKNLTKSLEVGVPVYMIIPSSDPVAYYRNDIVVSELRTANTTSLPSVINVIPYTSEIYGLNYIQLLHQKGCIEMSTTLFRGDLAVEKWRCPQSGS